MVSTRLAPPIFGVLARTAAARGSLSPNRLHPWVRAWLSEPDAEAWWIDREAGVALLRPELTVPGYPGKGEAVLAVRGSVLMAPPRSDVAPGWPPVPSAGETEILLYDLLARGSSAVRDLRGQFCLVAWDGSRRRMLLARDHLGQRCLFLRTLPDRIIFCSELSPLLRGPDVACELDAEGALWYLALGMPPPGGTLARDVARLPAAHVLVWEPGEPPLVERYWTPLTLDAPRAATDETVETIRRTLDRAIAARLETEDSCGVLLSGGVDSTYLATVATACGVRPLFALTSEFEERHGMNETPYAAAVARWLDLKHEVVAVTAEQGLDLLRDVVLSAAEPCAAWAAVTHFRVLARAQQLDVGVVLSGLGADEIFGGYDHHRGYYARLLRHGRRRPPPPGVDAFEAVLLPEEQSSRRILYPGIARFFDDTSLRRGLEEPYRRWHYASHLRAFYRECLRIKPEAHPLEMMVAHECQHRIPDMLFADFEPISRRTGIDVRYPFLDPDVVRVVAGLDAASRYRTASGRFSLRLARLHPRFKHTLLRVAAGRVPPEIIQRPRKSYTAPFGGWLFDPEFGRPVITALQESRFWRCGIVQRSWLNHILERVEPRPNPWVFQLWALVTLAGWFDRYVDPPVAAP